LNKVCYKEGKTYEERLRCLKLWTLEDRRNRQDLIEVLKICSGLQRLKLNELFTSDDNIRGTRVVSDIAVFVLKRDVKLQLTRGTRGHY